MSLCVCGHDQFEHPDDGDCSRADCECTGYAELCGMCQHPKSEHVGTGRCSRTIRRPGPQMGQPCGCTRYPAEEVG